MTDLSIGGTTFLATMREGKAILLLATMAVGVIGALVAQSCTRSRMGLGGQTFKSVMDSVTQAAGIRNDGGAQAEKNEGTARDGG